MKTITKLVALLFLSITALQANHSPLDDITAQADEIPLLHLTEINWTDAEIAYIESLNNKGTVNVATKINDSVYLPHANGTTTGFHYSLLKSFSDLANVNIEVQLVDWSDYFHKDGEDLTRVKTDPDYAYTPSILETVDLYLDGFTVLPWREKMFDIVPFIPSKQVVVHHQDTKNINSIKDLDGKRCAMVKDTSMEQNLINLSRQHQLNIEFIYTDTFEQMERMVAEGKADFTVFDSDQAYTTLKHYNNLVIAWPVSEIQFMGWAVTKEKPLISGILTKYIAYAQQQGILDRYWKQHYAVSFIDYLQVIDLGD